MKHLFIGLLMAASITVGAEAASPSHRPPAAQQEPAPAAPNVIYVQACPAEAKAPTVVEAKPSWFSRISWEHLGFVGIVGAALGILGFAAWNFYRGFRASKTVAAS